MKNYRKDENNFIIEKILDGSTEEDIIEANYDLTDLELTWEFNNYKCWKYQYVDTDNYNTNEIALHAIEKDGDVIDALTIDKLTTPTGAVLTESQVLELKDSYATYKYKVVDGLVVDKTASDKLQLQKDSKSASLKAEYMADIKWIDDADTFYERWAKRNPESTIYDTLHEDVMIYWDEARAKRDSNKVNLYSATKESDLTAIIYNPTHVKSMSELKK